MHQCWSRWAAVCVLGIAALALADVRVGAGADKKDDDKKPAEGKIVLDIAGVLTDKDGRDTAAADCYCKTYTLKVQEGRTYQIDLKSKDFDAYLRLEDAKGKQVADDDDGGGGLDSRIVYKAGGSGDYKIVASTFKANETGKFTLIVSETGGGKVDAGEPGKAIELKIDAAKGGVAVNGQLTNADPKDKAGKFSKLYTITLENGKDYRIHMKGNEKLDAFVRLEDEAGKLIREDEFGEPNESAVGITPTKTATYRIIATTYKGEMTGNFTLSVSVAAGKVVAGKDGTLTFQKGQATVVQGALAKTDPKDGQGKHYKAYAFEGQAGKKYSFELVGQGGFDAFSRLEDSAGMVVKDEEFDGKVSKLSYTVGKTGTYKFIATSFKAGDVGNFTLTAREEGAGAPPVIVGKAEPLNLTPGKAVTVAGKLAATDPKDGLGKHFKAYSFAAQVGKVYRFELAGQGGFDPELRVEDANGQIVKNEDFGNSKVSRLTFSPNQAGTFRAIASAFKPGMTGDYTLTAIDSEVKPATVVVMPAFQKVTVAEVVAQLTDDDGVDKDGKSFKVYTFKALPDKLYRVEMNGRTFDAQLRLEDEKGVPLKNEDFFDGRFSQLFVAPGKGGVHRVIATSATARQKGAFSLTITEIQARQPEIEAVVFERVSRVNGKLTIQDGIDNQGKFFKAYTLKALPGMSYRCEMIGAGFNAFLRLEDDAGKPVKNEDFGDGKVSRLDFKSDVGGTFRLIATSFKPGQVGEYALSIAEAEKGPPSKGFKSNIEPKDAKGGTEAMAKPFKLDNGKDTFDDSLTEKDALDSQKKRFKTYPFKTEKGKTYYFELTGKGGFDPFIRVEDMNGKVLKEEEFGDTKVSRLYFSPGQAGAYRVVASTFKVGMIGEFTLSAGVIEAKEAKVMPLKLDMGKAVAESALDATDGVLAGGKKTYKVYTFKGEAGKSYKIDMHSKAFDAYLYVKDDGGKTLEENDDNGESLDSRIFFKADKAGTYHINATSLAGGSGAFILSIAEFIAKEAKVLPLKLEQGRATVNGSLTSDDAMNTKGKYFKAYAFQAEQGKSYRFELAGGGKSAVDPFVHVEDEKGKMLVDEDFGDGKASRVLFKASVAGTYRVIASTYKAGMTGDFVLSAIQIETKDAKPEPLKLDKGSATVSGVLTDKDGQDNEGKFYKSYAFPAEKGKTYRCELTGGKSGLDPMLRLQDAQGKLVKDEDFGDGKVSRAFLTANQAATYHVVVSSFKPGATGDFTLSIAQVEVKAAKPQPLTFDKGKAFADGELTADDAMILTGNKYYKDYTFKGEAGKTYKIDMHSKAFDAYLYVKDDSGETLDQNDDNGDSLDSRIVFKVEKAGTYHIIATTLRPTATGKFLLSVGEPSQTDKLMARVKDLPGAAPAEQKQIVSDLQKHFETLGAKLGKTEAGLAMRIGQELEFSNQKLAAEAYAGFGKLLMTSTDPKVAQQGKMLAGAGRRLSLVGNTMQVKGSTVDGKEFDLSKLKGKVVLVDFWATWCGPCRAELPRVKKHYEKYHANGFEVIGISLDNAKSDLTGFLDKEKLPWTSIFDQGNVLADEYGVFSIPLAILVGRDGRVLSLDARGAELDRLLEEQFAEKK